MIIKNSSWLNLKRSDVTSQNGEDGVLEAIFGKIGVRNWWCVELGAHDGITNSNTWNLRKNHGWQGVLIESDAAKIEQLKENSGDNDIVAHAEVSTEEPNTLDRILLQTMIPKSFDLLSLDTDGGDQAIWRSLLHYSPRVVVIEVNSSFPPGVTSLFHKSGISSCVELAKRKGYELALHTGNCIFVQKQYVKLLGINTKNWEELFDSSWLEQQVRVV